MEFRKDPDVYLLSCSALIATRDAGKIVVVKPRREDTWDIPGGLARYGENPRVACEREVREETGLAIVTSRLLVADWAPKPSQGQKFLLVFACSPLGDDEYPDFKPQDRDEIADVDLVDMIRAQRLLSKRVFDRASRAIEALRATSTQYLENGEHVYATTPQKGSL